MDAPTFQATSFGYELPGGCGVRCWLGYQNTYSDPLRVLFLVKCNDTGSVVGTALRVAYPGTGRVEATFPCDAGCTDSRLAVSWRAYALEDQNLENPIAWCKSTEQLRIQCLCNGEPLVLTACSVAGELLRVDPVSGLATDMADTGLALVDIAWSPDGELFGITTSRLYRIDPLSGAAENVGAIGYGSVGLTFNCSGELFALTGSARNLLRINPSTGRGSAIGSTGFRGGGDIAFRSDGALFGCSTDALYRINPATGAATRVGPFGISGAVGLEFLPDDTLLLLAGNGSLLEVDVSTGAAYARGDISNINSGGLSLRGACAAPPPCTYSLSPSEPPQAPPEGETGVVVVTTHPACSWAATSNAPWIDITWQDTGSGTGAVMYAVDPNTGAARSGTLTIAGQVCTVTQGATSCTYTISPTTESIPAAGGSGAVNVTTSPSTDCAWTAATEETWIHITSGPGGTGSGTVSYTIDPAAASRTGTLTIAGQACMITQLGPGDSARLELTGMTVQPGSVDLNGQLTAVLAITNTGACPTTSVTSAGARFEFVDKTGEGPFDSVEGLLSGPHFVIDQATHTCSIAVPPLAPGESAQVTVSRIPVPTSVFNPTDPLNTLLPVRPSLLYADTIRATVSPEALGGIDIEGSQEADIRVSVGVYTVWSCVVTFAGRMPYQIAVRLGGDVLKNLEAVEVVGLLAASQYFAEAFARAADCPDMSCLNEFVLDICLGVNELAIASEKILIRNGTPLIGGAASVLVGFIADAWEAVNDCSQILLFVVEACRAIADMLEAIDQGMWMWVMRPVAGDEWTTGEEVSIRWTTWNTGPYVKIELSRDGGLTWKTLSDHTENDGEYTLLVQEPYCSTCRVRITPLREWSALPGVSDEFEIYGPWPPELRWSGASLGYVEDGVEPDSGSTGSPFVYQVRYVSARNSPPKSGGPLLHIYDGAGSEIAGSPFETVAADSYPFTSGRTYACTVKLALAGTYSYRFDACDMLGRAATGPAAAITEGPDVGGSLLLDDSESGEAAWAASGGTATVTWHQTTRKANSPTHSWWFGNEATGNYRSGSSRVQGTLISPEITVAAGSLVDVSFMQWRQVEKYMSSSRDVTQVLVKWGGGSFTPLRTRDSKTASSAVWEQVSIAKQLVPDGVTTMQLQFRFDSMNSSNNSYSGWYVDDIKVVPSPLEFVVDQDPIKVNEGATAQLGIRLSGRPTDAVGVSVTKADGDADLALTGMTTLTFTSANWMTYQYVTVAAAQDGDAVNGSATLRTSQTSGDPVASRDVEARESDDEGWTDDVESGLNGWTAAGGTTTVTWHQTTRKASSPTRSWWFGNEAAGNYRSGSSRVQGTLISPEITVAAGSLVDVSFMQWRQVEKYTSSSRDVTQVLVKWGGGSFTPLRTLDSKTASSAVWEQVSIAKQLVPDGVTTMQLQFRFDSMNSSNNSYSGWYVDDIKVLPSPLEFVIEQDPLKVDEGSSAQLGLRLSGRPMESVGVSISKADGDADLTLTGAMTLTFTPANWMTYQYVTVAAAEDPDAVNGRATLRISQTSGDAVATRDIAVCESDNEGWADDVESGASGWTASGGTSTVMWHQTTRKANSPTRSWWFGNEATGNYRSGSSRVQGTLISPEITVAAGSLVDVSFMQWRQVEKYMSSSRDVTQVLVKWGAGSFAPVWTQDSRNASSATWEPITVTKLEVPSGVTTMQLQFRFDSMNSSNNSYSGWYVDDIRVLPSADVGPSAFEPANVPTSIISPLAYPNPADTDVRFTVTGIVPQAVRVDVYDLAGSWIWTGETEADELHWDLISATGDRLANGVYLYKLVYRLEGGTWRLCRVEKLFVLGPGP